MIFAAHFAADFIAHIDAADLLTGALQATDPLPQMHRAARRRHEVGHPLPHLARPELRIQEALHQAGLGAFLRGALQALERFTQRMGQRLGDRESLDALCAPLG